MSVIGRLAAGVAALAISAGLSLAAAAETTWRAYTYNPSAAVAGGKGLLDLAERVEKDTNGSLKIQVHLGGSLPIKTTDITQAVSDGIVQFAFDGFFLGNVTIGGILRLPMLIEGPEEYHKAVDIMYPYLQQAFAERGCVVLGQYHYPLQVAWANKKLTSLADMKGLKMRVTAPEQGEFVRRFGGLPITIGAPEVPSSLQRGLVDGVFTASAGGGKIWGDMLTHNYRLGVSYFNSLAVANKAAYEALSDGERAALQKALDEITPQVSAQMTMEEQQVTDKLIAGGMVVTLASPEDVNMAVERMADYWNQWAEEKGPTHVEALQKVRAALGK